MSATAGPLEFRQRYADNIEAVQTHLDGRQAQIHTALPGHIVSYDPAKMTVSVQIGLQAIHQQIDGTIKPVTIQPITDVPVMFPTGGGHTMTFPIAPGDECLLIFTERNIDNWYQRGGVQQPNDYRMHDISDAMCFVGIRSQPNVLGAGGPAVGPSASATTVQLRSDDGKNYVEIDGHNGVINVKANNNIVLENEDGSSTVNVLGNTGEISIKCQRQITLDCPRVVVTGQINCWSEVIAQAQTNGYVTLSGHLKHSGNPSTPTPGT